MNKEIVDEMSVKEAITFTLDKIVKQGGQCIGENSCMYGTPNGRHCIVGWLLDESNDMLMEYEGDIIDLIQDCHTDMPSLIVKEDTLFSLLQGFHDFTEKVSRRNKLKELKEHYPNYIDLRNKNWNKWIELGE